MGFIFLSLVAGASLILLSLIACRLKFAKISKIISCVLSTMVSAAFFMKLFSGPGAFLKTFVVLLASNFLLILPISLNIGKIGYSKIFVFMTSCVIVLTGLVLGIGAGSGYEEIGTKVEEVNLIKSDFKYGNERYSFYLYENGDDYIYLKFDSVSGKFEEVKVSKEGTRIEEDVNCVEPKLVKYQYKARQTFWSFGLSKKYEYVFYVPKDAIVRDIFP